MKERIEALHAAGAETFDGPGFRFVLGLLKRADGLEGHAGELLKARAEKRLVRLELALSEARSAAEHTLTALRETDADLSEFEALFAASDFKTLQRQAPATLRATRGADPYTARARRLADEAASRGLALSSTDHAQIAQLTEPDTQSDRSLGDRLARALFRDTADQARGALVIARAAANVPTQVGPYNPQALAVQALELAETLSPAYLRAWLRDLESLAVLRNLPEPPRRRRRR